jgi:hypothetical protein
MTIYNLFFWFTIYNSQQNKWDKKKVTFLETKYFGGNFASLVLLLILLWNASSLLCTMFSYFQYSSNPTRVYTHANILISFINQLLGKQKQ